jgi:hypothetical protein
MNETATRPLWPRTAELFAQAEEALADIRNADARIDRSLAEIFIAATRHPLPEVASAWQGCSCAFAPRCESNRCCEDANQRIGLKDHRTGEIKKRAEWSVAFPLWRGSGFRLIFMCDECWQDYNKTRQTPLLGIDRPKHASDFWQPSIMEHIRLTRIRNEHDEKMREASEATKFAAFPEKPMTNRERAMTPEHWKRVLFIRQKFREYAQRD